MWKGNVCLDLEEISLCVTVHGHIRGGPNNWSTFEQRASQAWPRETSMQRLLLKTQFMMKSITQLRVNIDLRNFMSSEENKDNSIGTPMKRQKGKIKKRRKMISRENKAI